eukprot:387512-Pleurochrysis_carterae.AAC.1
MSSVRYWPMDLLGTLQIRLTLHNKNILIPKAIGDPISAGLATDELEAAQTLDFQMSNMFLGYDAISLPPAYMQMLRERLATGSYLPIVYRTYLDSNSAPSAANSHTHAYNIASSSINRVYAVLRLSDYSSKVSAGLDLGSGAVGSDSVVSGYFAFKSFEKNRSDTHDADLRYKFRVNNVSHPQYDATTTCALQRLAYLAPNSQGLSLETRRGFHY